MENINIVFRKPKKLQGQLPIEIETPFDERFGFTGIVTEVDPKNMTVNVLMDTGLEITGVRVASREWVTINESKDYLTGERHLPPVNTHVLCFMPSGDISNSIIIGSLFACADPMGGGITEYKEDSGDAAFIDKHIDNGGWKFIHDIRTGNRKITNSPKDGEETFSLEINQGNGKSNVKINVKGPVEIVNDEGISIKSLKTELLEIGNSIATLGEMISDHLQAGVDFKSSGSPANHTAPDFTLKCAEIKAKWDKVFK